MAPGAPRARPPPREGLPKPRPRNARAGGSGRVPHPPRAQTRGPRVFLLAAGSFASRPTGRVSRSRFAEAQPSTESRPPVLHRPRSRALALHVRSRRRTTRRRVQGPRRPSTGDRVVPRLPPIDPTRPASSLVLLRDQESYARIRAVSTAAAPAPGRTLGTTRDRSGNHPNDRRLLKPTSGVRGTCPAPTPGTPRGPGSTPWDPRGRRRSCPPPRRTDLLAARGDSGVRSASESRRSRRPSGRLRRTSRGRDS